MATLYDLTEDMSEILREIYDNDGELTKEIQQKLEINKENRDRKCLAYLEIIKNKKSFISNIDDEMKRLQALKKREVGRIEWLESNLINAIKVFGEFEVGTTVFSTTKRNFLEVDPILLEQVKNLNLETSIASESDLEIDSQYLSIKGSASLDKKAIKEAIKNKNIKLKHCRISTNEHLNIK